MHVLNTTAKQTQVIKTKKSKYTSHVFHSEINIACSLYAVLYPCNKKTPESLLCMKLIKPLKHFSFNALASAPHPHAPHTD